MGKLDLNGPRPPYVQIANDLMEAIVRQDLAPGERLPSITALAERYGVASGTIQSALAVLRDSAVVSTRRGTGSFVREDLDVAALSARLDAHGPTGDLAEVIRLLHEVLERVTALEQREARD
ncbi:GntR family transcriptional regulator [Pseudonocardia spinosispora]|uniref:GntR family transcriptional regulator n=1 Tax=Pseudonocardia spinosispora TaxID=103441 RepID=UPI000490B967|nr:GntR family transcriptional regulator [Pseudonocardia spinosispora]